jgi:hypothetical protein
MAVACTKPVDLGYPEELGATRTLALHARKHGSWVNLVELFSPR